MCEEVLKPYVGCGHLIFDTFWACDDCSEPYLGANEEGLEECGNYNAGVIHELMKNLICRHHWDLRMYWRMRHLAKFDIGRIDSPSVSGIIV